MIENDGPFLLLIDHCYEDNPSLYEPIGPFLNKKDVDDYINKLKEKYKDWDFNVNILSSLRKEDVTVFGGDTRRSD